MIIESTEKDLHILQTGVFYLFVQIVTNHFIQKVTYSSRDLLLQKLDWECSITSLTICFMSLGSGLDDADDLT